MKKYMILLHAAIIIYAPWCIAKFSLEYAGTPYISDNYVVFKMGAPFDEWVSYNFYNQKISPIPISSNQSSVMLHNNLVVWQVAHQLDGYDLHQEKKMSLGELTSPSGAAVSLFNNNLIFTVDNSPPPTASPSINHDIYGYNIISKMTYVICSNIADQANPVIYENTVVWEDNRNSNQSQGITNWDIYGYDLIAHTEFPICTRSGNQYSPKIWGDNVIWVEPLGTQGYSNLMLYNLLTQETSRILEEEIIGWATIHGNYILWRNHIYDISTGQTISGPWGNNEADMDGDIIVWNDIGGIYTTTIDIIFAEEIEIGKVKTGSTINQSGFDFSEKGYKDTIDEWFSFSALEEEDYVISACGSDFDTTLTVYDEDFKEVEFNDNYCGKQSKLTLRAEQGMKYYIRIAGYNGKTGHYMLSVINDGPEPLRSDINEDGNVNLVDMSIMAGEWLKP